MKSIESLFLIVDFRGGCLYYLGFHVALLFLSVVSSPLVQEIFRVLTR